MSPVRDRLRDRPERKPIITANYYAALNYTEILESDKDHIMVKVQLQGEKKTVTINAMVDSGATEDFIDSKVCKKHGIKMIKAKNPREIYLADGKPSAMGPVTHLTEVPMDISNHRELATFQVANLQHHEVILGCHDYENIIEQSIGKKRKSHSTANDVRHFVSTVRQLYMRNLKRKPSKRILSPDSPKSRPRKTRASKSKSYQLRPECLPKGQQRLQVTTCTQVNEQRFLLEDKSWLEAEWLYSYHTTPMDELHHEAD